MVDLYSRLLEAVSVGNDIAAIAIRQRLSPLPLGGRVYPPTFGRPDSDPYLIHYLVVDGAPRKIAVLDQPASQANRVEEAIEDAVVGGSIRYPRLEIVTDVAGVPVRLSAQQLPHRIADAYLEYSLVGDEPFDKSRIGTELRRVRHDDLSPLFIHDPASLVFGVWDSRRPGVRIKVARSYVSEMYGLDPTLGMRYGSRMDPVNLQGSYSSRSEHGFTYTADKSKKKAGDKGDKISEIGLGNIAPTATHGGVGISEARRVANVTVAGTRRLRFAGAPGSAAARVALIALSMFGDRRAFGGAAIWLRSGCELAVVEDSVTLVLRGENNTESLDLSADDWAALYERALDDAAEGDLAVRTEAIQLTPRAELQQALEYSLTKVNSGEEQG